MRKPEAGFTLIEVLIAVTLVALLAVGMLTAMHMGLSAMGKADDRLLSNRRAMSTQQILEEQVAGLLPVPADCRSAEGPGAKISFFQGQPQSMRFVSTFSLHQGARSVPMILEFQVIPGENAEGVRLVLNERPYLGALFAGLSCAGRATDPNTGKPVGIFLPIEIGPTSFVMADKLAFCRFQFRMPPNPGQPPTPKWFPVWGDADHLPDAIRVDMGPLNPDPARLQPVSLTMPVRVNRWPLEIYDGQS